MSARLLLLRRGWWLPCISFLFNLLLKPEITATAKPIWRFSAMERGIYGKVQTDFRGFDFGGH